MQLDGKTDRKTNKNMGSPITCTAPQKEAASAIGSAAGEHPGAVNMIFFGGLETKSSIALMAAPLSH